MKIDENEFLCLGFHTDCKRLIELIQDCETRASRKGYKRTPDNIAATLEPLKHGLREALSVAKEAAHLANIANELIRELEREASEMRARAKEARD